MPLETNDWKACVEYRGPFLDPIDKACEPRLGRAADVGWIVFSVLRRLHSTLHKQRNSDLKIIADQQGHGMRTHPDAYVQSGVAERKAEATKLYADFTGVLNNRG